MKDYIKLAKIRYKNTDFVVFENEHHEKVFLEVKIKNGKEKYYHPVLEDAIDLQLIFSNYQRMYRKKYRIKDRLYTRLKRNSPIANFTLGLFIGVTLTCSYKLIKEHYPLFGYSPDHVKIITDNSELDMEEVTFRDLTLTLLNNKKIKGKYRDYTLEYIKSLEERLPDIDLRIFNKNLETLYFEVVPLDKWKEEGIDGYYDYTNNYICVKEEYKKEETEKSVVYHELTHATNSGIYKKVKINDEYYKVKKSYQDLENEYGTGTMEAFTEIITEYLLAENYENYFDKERHNFRTYGIPATNVYQLFKLTDDYSIYDYFTGDIYKFEASISEYGLENMLPLIDLEIDKNKDKNVVLVEEYDLEYYQDIMYKERFRQIITEEKNKSETDELFIYKKAKSLATCLTEDKLKIIDEFYKDSFIDIKPSKDSFPLVRSYKVISSGKVTTNSFEYNGSINIEIYDGENKIICGEPSSIFFYKDKAEKEYRVGYLEYTYIKAVNSEVKDHYDAKTKKLINVEEEKILYINEFLDYFIGIDGMDENSYSIKIDMSKINSDIERRLNVERILKMNK